MGSMSSKSRLGLFVVSTSLVLVVTIGGLIGTSALARQQAFPHLAVFEDVVSLIRGSYVQPVDIDKVMDGAMRGLTDSLDADSAYLPAAEVKIIQANAPLPAGDTGLVVTRQVYLRVLAVRPGSPAARAGLRMGDYVRSIDGTSTRETSVVAGTRALRGEPGSKVTLTVFRGNLADLRDFPIERVALPATDVTSRRLDSGEGYVELTGFSTGTAAAIGQAIDTLHHAGATRAIIDLRDASDGSMDEAILAARLFVKKGTLGMRAGRDASDRTVIAAQAGDGAITMPIALLISNGTAGAAEVFAAALSGNERADLVGAPTAGLAAVQHLITLPDGNGLWLTVARYLTPDGQPIHERGLRPTLGVDTPYIGFDETPPTTDAVLSAAVARLKKK